MGNNAKGMHSTLEEPDRGGRASNYQQEPAAPSVEKPSPVTSSDRKKPCESPLMVGPYALGEQLGAGQFGLVHVGIHSETGAKVAMKKVRKEKFEAEEIRLQRLLDHENVVKVHDVIEVGDDVYIVMDYVSGGDLGDHLVKHMRLTEYEARRLFQQLIRGVEHCHQHMIVHRDLKVENILVDRDANIKIVDFGLAAQMQPEMLLTKSCGSPNFAAPELLYKGCHYKGPEIDVWSCGVVLFALLTNRLPFHADNFPKLFKSIKRGRYSVPSHVSLGAEDLLARMLTVDPEQRITIAEIRKHAWFAGSVGQEARPAEACRSMDPLPSAANICQNSELSTKPATVRRETITSATSVVIKPEAAFKDMPVRCGMSCAAFENHLGPNAIQPMLVF